jgi:ribosome modulation factor
MDITRQLIKSATEEKPHDFKKVFEVAIAEKISDALQGFKIQVASRIMNEASGPTDAELRSIESGNKSAFAQGREDARLGKNPDSASNPFGPDHPEYEDYLQGYYSVKNMVGEARFKYSGKNPALRILGGHVPSTEEQEAEKNREVFRKQYAAWQAGKKSAETGMVDTQYNSEHPEYDSYLEGVKSAKKAMGESKAVNEWIGMGPSSVANFMAGLKDAEARGLQAKMEGKSKDTCPHQPGTEEHSDWMKGYKMTDEAPTSQG